jgi:hypothetical protein
MSAIQARIHAFESLGQGAPKQPVPRKPPIDLYGGAEGGSAPKSGENGMVTALSTGDGSMDKINDDEAHNLLIGSITSDFVKVSPPRSRAPPLPPRKTGEMTASTPSTPSVDGDSISYSTMSNSHLKSPPTPRPIPSKGRTLGPTTGTNGGLHAYPRNGRGHNHAVSSSSFHSVSLSDHGDGEHDELDHELGGSYEAVSPHASSVFSLIDRSSSMASSPAMSAASLGPPALPPRPSTTTPTSDSQQIPVSYAVRKVPPPPSALSNTRLAQSRGHKRQSHSRTCQPAFSSKAHFHLQQLHWMKYHREIPPDPLWLPSLPLRQPHPPTPHSYPTANVHHAHPRLPSTLASIHNYCPRNVPHLFHLTLELGMIQSLMLT